MLFTNRGAASDTIIILSSVIIRRIPTIQKKNKYNSIDLFQTW